jgi:hypothetical protein
MEAGGNVIYLKSAFVGLALLIGCIAIGTCGLFAIGRDLRAIMGHFPLVSLPTMVAIFATGFLWKLRGRNKEETVGESRGRLDR